MDPPFLTVTVYPDPGDDRTIEDVRGMLLERGARADDDGYFVERRRRMRVQQLPHWDEPGCRLVQILMSAGPLGDPGYARREMVTFARYVTGLLVAVADRVRPLYGGIGAEQIFPTPDHLRKGIGAQGFVTDPFFVRRDLLARADLAAVLTGEYRKAVDCSAGTVFASWWPFVDGQPSSPGGLPIDGTWAGGQKLGQVVTRYVVERERAAQNGDETTGR